GCKDHPDAIHHGTSAINGRHFFWELSGGGGGQGVAKVTVTEGRYSTCHDGTFKPDAGNDACQSCPARSQASYAAATICACHNGFYRAETDQPGDPCTAPPSKPRNIVSTVNKTTVDLSWEAPLDDGGRDDLVFKVVCQQCSESGVCTQCDDSVQYVPSKDDIRATWVKIQGLMAHTRYKFEVHAENGVSEESGVTDRFESIALKTNVAGVLIAVSVGVTCVINSLLTCWKGVLVSPESLQKLTNLR
ncbi:Ephrin type-B receptor 3, partial [Branchiostoma belcheri]